MKQICLGVNTSTIEFSYTYSKLPSSYNINANKQTESLLSPQSTLLLARMHHCKGDRQLYSITAGKAALSLEQLQFAVRSNLCAKPLNQPTLPRERCCLVTCVLTLCTYTYKHVLHNSSKFLACPFVVTDLYNPKFLIFRD